MEEAVAVVSRTLEVELVVVAEVAEDSSRMLLRAGVGWEPGVIATPSAAVGRDSLVGHAVATEAPVVCEERPAGGSLPPIGPHARARRDQRRGRPHHGPTLALRRGRRVRPRAAELRRRRGQLPPGDRSRAALAAWALDELIVDRRAAPWPAVRGRVTRGSVFGVDAALRAYAAGTAATSFDAGGLVQALIAQTPLSPGPNDGTVVLWLLGVGIDRCSRSLSAEEPGLRALIERRANIAERLALELDERAFTAPDVGSFDPDAALDEPPGVYLSPMEALLLDIAVAPSQPDESWLTYPQAEELFGEQTRNARADTRAQRRLTAVVLSLAGLLGGAVLALGLELAAAASLVAICGGLALALVGIGVALAYARPAVGDQARTDAIGIACATGALCAALNAINQGLERPLFADAPGLIAGALIAVVAGILWIVLKGATDGGPQGRG